MGRRELRSGVVEEENWGGGEWSGKVERGKGGSWKVSGERRKLESGSVVILKWGD